MLPLPRSLCLPLWLHTIHTTSARRDASRSHALRRRPRPAPRLLLPPGAVRGPRTGSAPCWFPGRAGVPAQITRLGLVAAQWARVRAAQPLPRPEIWRKPEAHSVTGPRQQFTSWGAGRCVGAGCEAGARVMQTRVTWLGTGTAALVSWVSPSKAEGRKPGTHP